MGDINANRMTISKQMLEGMVKDPNTKKLVDKILADGVVNDDDTASLNELKTNLETLAKQDDGSLDADEKLLIENLTGIGWLTDEEVTKKNLQSIQSLQKQHSSNPTALNFNKENPGVNITVDRLLGDEQKVLRLRNLEPEDSSLPPLPASESQTPTPTATATPTATESTPAAPSQPTSEASSENATAVAQLTPTETQSPEATPAEPVSSPQVSPADLARQQKVNTVTQPLQIDRDQAVKKLQEQTSQLRDTYADPQKVSDQQLRADLNKLAESAEDEPAYVINTLNQIGISKEQLVKEGVITQEQADSNYYNTEAKQKLEEHLSKRQFTDTEVKSYRSLLVNTAQKYIDNPTSANRTELKQRIYEHSYVFEPSSGPSSEGLTAGDLNNYYGFKQTLLDVAQKENLLESVQVSMSPGSSPLPTTLKEINESLTRKNNWAQEDVSKFVGEASSLISQIEANPAAFNNVDLTQLKTLVGQLGTASGTPPSVTLNCLPLGQNSLKTINEAWAEIEKVGLTAGLNKDTETLVSSGIEQVDTNNPLSAALKQNSSLLSNPKLLAALNDPANAELLKAVKSGNLTQVKLLYSQYSSAQLNRTLSLITGTFSPVMNMMGIQPTAVTQFATNFVNQFRLGAATSTTEGGNNLFSSSTFNVGANKPNYGFTTGINLDAGKNLVLEGVSSGDLIALMESLNATPEEQKAALFANLDNLETAAQDDPALHTIQQQVNAKETFDKAFWNKSSALDQAQSGVSSALERQTEFSSQLKLAKLAIEEQKSGNISADARKQLNNMSAAIDVALAAIQKGEPIPETVGPALEQVSRTLASHEKGTDLGVRFLKTAETGSMLAQVHEQLSNPESLQTLQNRMNSLTETRPELKPIKDQIDAFASKPDEYMANMEKILSQPNLDPAVREQIIANLNSLKQLVQKSDQSDVSNEQFLEFGNTPLGKAGTSPFSAITEMHALSKFSQSQGETVNLGERTNALYDWADKQTTANPDKPVTRAQVFGSLGDNIKSYEKFYNQDQIDDLAKSANDQTKIEEDMSAILGQEGPTRTALQNIWSGSAGLSGDINLRGGSQDLTKFASELEKRVGALKGSSNISPQQQQELAAAQALLLALKGPPGNSKVGLIAVAVSRQDAVTGILRSAGFQQEKTEKNLTELLADPAFRSSEAAKALPDLMDITSPPPPTQEEINALCAKAPPQFRSKLLATLQSHFATNALGLLSERLEKGPPLTKEDTDAAVTYAASQAGNEFLLSMAPNDRAPQTERDAHARLLQEYNNLLGNLPPGMSPEDAIKNWISSKSASGELTENQAKRFNEIVTKDLAPTRSNFSVVTAGEAGITNLAATLNMPSLAETTTVNAFTSAAVNTSQIATSPSGSTSDTTSPVTATTTTGTSGSPVSPPPAAAGPQPSAWATMQSEGRRRRDRIFGANGILRDPNRPLGQARERFRATVGLPPLTVSANQPPLSPGSWFNAASGVTGMRAQDIAAKELAGEPIGPDVSAMRADLQQNTEIFNQANNSMGDYASVLKESVPFIAQTLGVELPPDILAGLQGSDGPRSISRNDAQLSQDTQSLVDQADELANAILSPKPMVDGRDAMAGLIKDFLENIRNLDFQTRKLVMAQFTKRLMNNMITKLYGEKNLENAKYHEKAMDQFKARMKEGIERAFEAAESQASSTQAAMAIGGDLGAKTGGAVADASVSDQALRDDASQFLEPAVQDGVLSRVQKQKILQALFEGSSVTGQAGLMSMLSRFQQVSSSIITQ